MGHYQQKRLSHLASILDVGLIPFPYIHLKKNLENDNLHDSDIYL